MFCIVCIICIEIFVCIFNLLKCLIISSKRTITHISFKAQTHLSEKTFKNYFCHLHSCCAPISTHEHICWIYNPQMNAYAIFTKKPTLTLSVRMYAFRNFCGYLMVKKKKKRKQILLLILFGN